MGLDLAEMGADRTLVPSVKPERDSVIGFFVSPFPPPQSISIFPSRLAFKYSPRFSFIVPNIIEVRKRGEERRGEIEKITCLSSPLPPIILTILNLRTFDRYNRRSEISFSDASRFLKEQSRRSFPFKELFSFLNFHYVE